MLYNNEVSDAFDLLRNKVIDALDIQWNNGRLSGTDYANAFTQLMNTVVQEAVRMPKIKKDLEIADKQLINLDKQTDKLDKDMTLIDRQIKGYDDNLNAKLFTAQLNTWGVMFSSGLLEEKPSIIKNDELSSLYNKLKR